MSDAYVCPSCRAPLEADAASLVCASCGAVYPVSEGIADFSGGAYYDSYLPGQELAEEHQRGLGAEVFGSRWRIESTRREWLIFAWCLQS